MRPSKPCNTGGTDSMPRRGLRRAGCGIRAAQGAWQAAGLGSTPATARQGSVTQAPATGLAARNAGAACAAQGTAALVDTWWPRWCLLLLMPATPECGSADPAPARLQAGLSQDATAEPNWPRTRGSC